jgi:hypothetical protein
MKETYASNKETHVLNEETNSLEPVDSKCAYCNSGHSQSREDNYFCRFYKEQDRSNLIVYKSVKYRQIRLEISRCPNCLKIHREAKSKAILISCFVGLIAIWFTGLLGLIIIVIMILIYRPLEKMFVRRENILTKRDGAAKCYSIKFLMRYGWDFEKPST